jgi:hypothetical protein
MRTGELRVSMRFIGPEEGGVVAASRTPGLGLLGVSPEFSPSDAASPSGGGGEEADGGGKGEYSGT